MRSLFSLLLAGVLAASGGIASVANAAEGLEVTARQAAPVYDGPSDSGKPLYLLSLNYPLLVLSRFQGWLKVCLHDGDIGYIKQADARSGDTAIVKDHTVVRFDPYSRSAISFRAGKDLLLFVEGEQIDGWLPVRHESGKSGFVDIRMIFSATAGGVC